MTEIMILIIVFVAIYFFYINIGDNPTILECIEYHAIRLVDEVLYNTKGDNRSVLLASLLKLIVLGEADRECISSFVSRNKNIPPVIAMAYKILEMELDRPYMQEMSCKRIRKEISAICEILNPENYDELWSTRAIQFIQYKGMSNYWNKYAESLDSEYAKYRQKDEIPVKQNFKKEILPEAFIYFICHQATYRLKHTSTD